MGNAGESIHKGIEFGIDVKPFSRGILNNFSISGNLNLSQNYFKKYIEIIGVGSAGNIITGNDYSDNKILLNPDIIANASLSYFHKSFGAYISLQQYW